MRVRGAFQKLSPHPRPSRLEQRVRDLEARLMSTSPSYPTHGIASTHTTPQPGSNSSTAEDSEIQDSQLPTSAPVDTLATGAFDQFPAENIGYFGPSSNHFLFGSLSNHFAASVRLQTRHNNQVVLPPILNRDVTSSQQPPPQEVNRNQYRLNFDPKPKVADIWELPDNDAGISLINRFFITVGSVIPCVDQSGLLAKFSERSQGNEHRSRPLWALLNIIFAHASIGLVDRDPSPFYLRTLDLLDEQTLRGSSLELVQALIFLANFQQNNQRSIASWTFHALAVKATFQLGLHSVLSYQNLTSEESEMRKRIWYAVVNQDRSLAAGLGRPSLIPSQYVRVSLPQVPDLNVSRTTSLATYSTDSMIYFNQLISLQSIKSTILDSIYDNNLGSADMPSSQELAIKRLQLMWQLFQWKESTSTFYNILSESDIHLLTTSLIDRNRFQIILSIHYHCTVILVNGPILDAFLKDLSKDIPNVASSALLLESMVPAIKDDLSATTCLQIIIEHITNHSDSFIDRNGLWWTCNYSLFTISLHLFGILMACRIQEDVFHHQQISIPEVRSLLLRSLNTLDIVGRKSLMSCKARHCLMGFLEVFDALTSQQQEAFASTNTDESRELITPGMSSFISQLNEADPLGNYFADYITQSADNFLFQYSQNVYLDGDLSMLENIDL
ncbi:hypothetical protein B7463_g3168, partial [Scytalidium lignicola]